MSNISHSRTMSEDDIREAMYRYGTGESLVVIGKLLGFDAGTVRRALLGKGVPLSDTHGRQATSNSD